MSDPYLSDPPYALWSIWKMLSVSQHAFIFALGGLCIFAAFVSLSTFRKLEIADECRLNLLRKRSTNLRRTIEAAFCLFGVVLFLHLQTVGLQVMGSAVEAKILGSFRLNCAFAVNVIAIFVLAFLCCAPCHAQQPASVNSICKLQDTVAPGTHINVRVSGVYGPGLDHTVLLDAECPNVSTWVELDLRSQKNKGKLRKLLDRSRQARVVVEGEFYGPSLPDPKLPDAIKSQYHPGWGHLAAFSTKIVVYRINSVSGTGDDAR